MEIQFKRVTPEVVIEAYKKTGLQPVTSVFIDEHEGQICSCGLGAVVRANHMELDVWDIDNKLQDMGAEDIEFLFGEGKPHEYLNGFIWGFDGSHPESKRFEQMSTEDQQMFILGHEDGTACNQALFTTTTDSDGYRLITVREGVL
jgi:hypothetical protein